jgi:hypothetical protein
MTKPTLYSWQNLRCTQLLIVIGERSWPHMYDKRTINLAQTIHIVCGVLIKEVLHRDPYVGWEMFVNTSRYVEQLDRSTLPLWRIFLIIFFWDPGDERLKSCMKTVQYGYPLFGRGGTHRSRIRIRIRTCSEYMFRIRIRTPTWYYSLNSTPNDSREIPTSLFQRRFQTSRYKETGICLRLGVKKNRHQLPCPSVLRVVDNEKEKDLTLWLDSCLIKFVEPGLHFRNNTKRCWTFRH